MADIGPKVEFTTDTSYFLPTRLGIGFGLMLEFDPYNKAILGLDFGKLLIPTPGGDLLASDPAIIESMLGSFSDAPGGGSEELSEITLSVGGEYWYNDIFAIRAGYFRESPQKGNRTFFTLGTALKYRRLTIDFSYLIPNEQGHPLGNTIRIGLSLRINKAKQEEYDELD